VVIQMSIENCSSETESSQANNNITNKGSNMSKTAKMKRALKSRDIESVLWELCIEAVNDIEMTDNPRIGRQTFSNLLSTLSQMEMLKRRREDKNYDKAMEDEAREMKDWLKHG